jgi:hypothetical protein
MITANIYTYNFEQLGYVTEKYQVNSFRNVKPEFSEKMNLVKKIPTKSIILRLPRLPHVDKMFGLFRIYANLSSFVAITDTKEYFRKNTSN